MIYPTKSIWVLALVLGLTACFGSRANCVLYARNTLVNDLPLGLYTIKDKKQHITTDEPQIGYTVVMKPNHVAVVVGVSPLHITVRHENWPSGSGPSYTTFERSDSRIYGYIPTSLKPDAKRYLR